MSLSIEDLYPDATREQREEAHRRLSAYVRLVLRIQEHMESQDVDEATSEAYDDPGRRLSVPNNQRVL